MKAVLRFSVLAVSGFLMASSAIAGTVKCKLLMQPKAGAKFQVVEMMQMPGESEELGLSGSNQVFSVVLNGAKDLSYVNVQVTEIGSDQAFLSINGAKNIDGEFSVGATVRKTALALTCKTQQ